MDGKAYAKLLAPQRFRTGIHAIPLSMVVHGYMELNTSEPINAIEMKSAYVRKCDNPSDS